MRILRLPFALKIESLNTLRAMVKYSGRLRNGMQKCWVREMKIIKYEEKYRDDMIFMILQAKDALGRVPGLNNDLLDVKENYLDKGDMFWIAIDDNDRVIGSVGYSSIDDTDEVWLHRLFVKSTMKRQGIGSALLEIAEQYIKEQGKKMIRVHLGGEEWFESRAFYPKHGYVEYDERYMKKEL